MEESDGGGLHADPVAKPPVVAAVRIGREVGVAKRHLDASVTQNLLKPKEVASIHDPVARKRVAKAVKRDAPAALSPDDGAFEICPVEHPMKDLLKHAARGSEHPPVAVSEDESSRVTQPPCPQDRQEGVEDRHIPGPPTLGRTVVAPANRHEPPIEVDVRPLKARDLARAKPGVHRGRVEHVDRLILFARCLEKSGDFVGRTKVPVIFVELRDPGLADLRHLAKPSELDREVEH